MKKFILYTLLAFVVGICGGIFADQILWPYFIERPLFEQYSLEQRPVYVTERNEVTIQENTALQDSVEKVDKAVAGIVTQADGKTIKGSGLVITADGLIVTLADLVPQGGKFSILVEGQPVSFTVLKRDLESNLALIKVEKNNLLTVGFANLDNLRKGQRVFLVGAFQTGQAIETTVNEGMVKYFDKDTIYTNIMETTTLAGSALFNIQGEFLGLNTVDYWGRVSALPIDKIRSFAGF